MKPDLILLGQFTVDHVVPAQPGPWEERIGGNVLYAAAAARLWLEPARIGVVARLARNFPGDPAALLDGAGIACHNLPAQAMEALVEWMLYEPDGSRRSLPRNASLRSTGTETGNGAGDTYRRHLAALSASVEDIPPAWLPAPAIYLAAQVAERHRESVARLRTRSEFLTVDPSPHYSRSRDVTGLVALLKGTSAFLPGEHEVRHLAAGGWQMLAARLQTAGFPEVCLQRGAEGVLVATPGGVTPLPAPETIALDPTGAGDAFGGAYAACRLQGLPPLESARRAQVAAALVVECRGASAALALDPLAAARRMGLEPPAGDKPADGEP